MSSIWLLLLCCAEPTGPEAGQHTPSPAATRADQSAEEMELPPPIRDPDRARGQLLRYGSVEGYRSRRLDFDGDTAFLVRGDPRSPDHQREADRLAEAPALVLLVSTSADLAAAEHYLRQIDGIVRVEDRSLEATEDP